MKAMSLDEYTGCQKPKSLAVLGLNEGEWALIFWLTG